ncbi:MAG: ABC transporter ATP-binding protein, partial [Pseudomonadota bacterium]
MLTSVFHWFETRNAPFPERAPERPPRTLLAFIIHYARPFWPLLATVATVGTILALLQVWLFALVGNLVDWLAEADRATFLADHGWSLALLAALVLLVMPVLNATYEATVHQGLLGNFAMRIRWDAHRYLLRQSMTFFQDDFAGRIATKVMQTSLAARDTVMTITEVMIYVCIYFLGAVALFGASDLRLTVPLVLWLAGYVGVLWYFIPRLQVASKAQSDSRSIVTGRIVDSYTNINTVKMFAHTADEDAYARDGMGAFLGTVHTQMRLVTKLNSLLHLLNAWLIFSVAGVAIWLWSASAITTGAIAFATALVLRLQGMSQWILWEVARLFENIGIVEDGMETIARHRDVTDAPDAHALAVNDGGIAFSNVTFNYGKDLESGGVIEGLSLDIKPGEKVGLVGRSGAGKSTLVNLLLRFYDLEAGRISIDGQDVSTVTQSSLRAAIGMVTQDTSLLHRSIRENIRYGRPSASDAEVLAAATQAEAADFIGELEDASGNAGFDAQVGERGVKLSGGQRQRIAIARVLLKDAPILILDEATSALDSEVEAA